jgi:two-component system KDP operon response regulator KdpE
MTSVLVADPDPSDGRLLRAALRFGGYGVEVVRTPARAASLLRLRRFDAVVVDPARTGPADTVAGLRAQTGIPIIVVSASCGEHYAAVVLDAGADDCLPKPFSEEELLARLRVALRRFRPPEVTDGPITTADFTIHLADRRWMRGDGTEIRLTPTEWRLVEILVRHAGHLVPKADLVRGVWGPDAVTKKNHLRVHLTNIRKKLEPEPARPRYFITAPGLGLRFDPHPSDQLQPC